MAEAVKHPQSVNTEEVDLTTVKVKLVIPGLAVEKKFFGSCKPKKGVAEVAVKFENSSLEVDAAINDKKGAVTKYGYRVNKLPGEISSCTEEYKKDQVILTLTKKEEMSWAVMLGSGLDQAPSDS